MSMLTNSTFVPETCPSAVKSASPIAHPLGA
jgi:hypothetical protein